MVSGTRQFQLHGVAFEWDIEKALLNSRKHGVVFEDACEAFFDPFVMVVHTETVEGEQRHSAIGLLRDWRLIYIAFVWRGDTIRVISARSVSVAERKRYEDG